ncbi:MAG TPA: sigma-70 family RNA polymerase sigma factor [Acidimicrobiia bacterium]|nr:sigma-70 family RNA polymerase sigma factor [Acidimicrobiia bacterium]
MQERGLDTQPNHRIGRDVERDSSVYRSQARELERFAAALVGFPDAEDVVSAAFLKAITAPRWAAVKNRRAYLYKAVLNEARSHHRSVARRRAREHRALDQWVVTPPDPQPEVLAAVGRLSARQQAVVLLFFWEDLDESAVAGRLGISKGSVRKHRGRALERLRLLLSESSPKRVMH